MLLDYKSGWTKILKISDKDALSLISVSQLGQLPFTDVQTGNILGEEKEDE